MSSVVIPLIFGLAALAGYWVLANLIEFAWNLWRAGERLAIEDLRDQAQKLRAADETIATLEARLDNRKQYEDAVSALTPLAESGAAIIREILDCFQLSPIPPERWENARMIAYPKWIVEVQLAIQEQCPTYLAEFVSAAVGTGDFFDGANARLQGLNEIIRQLREAAEKS